MLSTSRDSSTVGSGATVESTNSGVVVICIFTKESLIGHVRNWGRFCSWVSNPQFCSYRMTDKRKRGKDNRRLGCRSQEFRRVKMMDRSSLKGCRVSEKEEGIPIVGGVEGT